jgi:hypothetical protein
MSHLQCNGHETFIYDCRRKEHSEHDCTHAQDVGVYCSDGERPLLFLFSSITMHTECGVHIYRGVDNHSLIRQMRVEFRIGEQGW